MAHCPRRAAWAECVQIALVIAIVFTSYIRLLSQFVKRTQLNRLWARYRPIDDIPSSPSARSGWAPTRNRKAERLEGHTDPSTRHLVRGAGDQRSPAPRTRCRVD